MLRASFLCVLCRDYRVWMQEGEEERHVAWLLIALLVCRNLILYVCDCFSLVFVWHLSVLFAVWWSHLQLQHW